MDMTKGSSSPAAKPERRGSVLRREALGRLRQINGGPSPDEDDGSLPDGGREVPSERHSIPHELLLCSLQFLVPVL